MIKDIDGIFIKQKQNLGQLRKTTAKERKRKLALLENAVLKYREKLKEAIYNDFGKPHIETDITEISQALIEIRYQKRHIANWMRMKSIPTPTVLFGTSSYLLPEPKGNVLIIAPWNYPINLCLVPLAGAIAAGNAIILKPSELTPNTTEVIRELIEYSFEENEVSVITGGVDISKQLLKLPFNHIFFTGSPRVGKLIMEAASKNLADITLELGGKSPAILDEGADMKLAMRRIVWSKMINCGQTCIAPDYLLAHESHREDIEKYFLKHVRDMFGPDPASSPDLGRILNKANFDRLRALLDDSSINTSKQLSLGEANVETRFFPPTMVLDTRKDSRLMNEEIFGPILPVIFFSELEEAISYINDDEKPLALYIYSQNKKNIKKVLEQSSSGSVVINHGLIQFSNINLPFGGINNSGLGKYHGKYSFSTFSHEKPIVKQWFPITASSIFSAPYSGLVKRVLNFMVRWM